jgi:MFS family permease
MSSTLTRNSSTDSKDPKGSAIYNSALKNRNLQLYFGGQVISMIGTWMQQMALSWLIYRLTNSAFMLGMVGFASQVPALFLTPYAGIIADRTNRHRLILATQILASSR